MTAPARKDVVVPDPRAATLVVEISRLVQRFVESAQPIVVGGLQLTAAECNLLEDITGLGSTQSAAALLKAVERLAAIKIGDIRIPFTPGQLHELQHRAQKRGRTVEAEMRAVVARIEDDLFYKGG
jgi:hypothetical protein